eukprot:3818929-Amphidinium_carterae.1
MLAIRLQFVGKAQSCADQSRVLAPAALFFLRYSSPTQSCAAAIPSQSSASTYVVAAPLSQSEQNLLRYGL